MEIISELKKSKKFVEGKNTSSEFCSCEKCSVSRYRHTHEQNLSDPEHSYWDFLKYCIDCADPNGVWLEFGVGSGKSISYMAEHGTDAEIYGFDSFMGLPEDWIFSDTKIYEMGAYSRDGKLPIIYFENVELIVGLFEDTLQKFCDSIQKDVAFIHIDCDLYSSTFQVLDTLQKNNRIKEGTIILFDEFYNYQNFQDYEYKAFKDFVSKYAIKYEWIAHTESFVDWNGNQAALRII